MNLDATKWLLLYNLCNKDLNHANGTGNLPPKCHSSMNYEPHRLGAYLYSVDEGPGQSKISEVQNSNHCIAWLLLIL